MIQKLSPKTIIYHVLFMGFIWWVLTKEDYISWILGIPAIIASLFLRAYIEPDSRWSIRVLKLVPFILFFLKQSLIGGIDVIWRAFHPKRPLSPDFIQYNLKIQNLTAQIFFANAVSLLPGTFTAHLEEQCVNIHVLDQSLPNLENLEILEKKAAALFGENIG